jgi:NTE family protein
LPGSVGDRIAKAYDEHLFHGKTLQDMPDEPRFVINATNVQSGALWRFMKPYMRDYRVGEVRNPKIPLAQAVAASSAFPPVLSPFELRLRESDFEPGTGLDLQRPPFTTRVVLSDGGVYDNLGLETAWKRHQTVLVSDAGGKTQEEEAPETDWPRHSYRVLNLIDNQVRSLRKRQVIDSFVSGTRKGAYWGIRTDIADYQLPDALNCPLDRTTQLAELPTRLKRLDERTQERLINWGYAVCDAALRKHLQSNLQPKPGFPYPQSGV